MASAKKSLDFLFRPGGHPGLLAPADPRVLVKQGAVYSGTCF